ncbi:MAG: hypothetical protein U0903_06100 [Planctomycetales bacterium]
MRTQDIQPGRGAGDLFCRYRIDGFAFDAEVVYLTHFLKLPFRRVAVTLINEYASHPVVVASCIADACVMLNLARAWRENIIPQRHSRQMPILPRKSA